jgi:Holliday junction resolvase RusA-like endonuclease
MAKGDIHIVNLPYFLTIGKKRYSCNLNQYRNAHYRLTNAMKKQFKDEITNDVLDLPENMQQVKIHYRVFYENKRKFDLDNVVSVISKFAQDALVELGRLPDDNYEHIVQITGTFGGVDRDNPRVEMRIKEI